MPMYTLYYFNGRGRAEICRMLFAAAGVQYTDRRIEFQDWDLYKDDMPGSCLPVLEIDRKHRIPETMAIARFLAREYDFYGKNNMDMFRNDYICDCLYEVMHAYMRYFHAKNGHFRSELSPGMSSGMIPRPEVMDGNDYNELQQIYMVGLARLMPFLERTLSMRNGGKSFFLGEQLMLCDMMCYCFLEGPYKENNSLFSKFPLIMGLRKRVSAHPKISSYLKSRCSSLW